MKNIVYFPNMAIMGLDNPGCSLGIAVKRLGLSGHVTGIEKYSEDICKKAKSSGAVDEYTSDLVQGISDCDLLILNIPSREIISLIPQIASSIKPGCIVTDTCALKKDIMDQATAHFAKDCFFIGSHPMIHMEKRDINNAGEIEFQGKTAFVAFVPDTDQTALARLSLFWKALGMVPFLIDPARHDKYMALAESNPSFKKILEERNLKEYMDILSRVTE
jgi:cyclohexadieny/prephenate dehydrogenase